jgi:hypothetical protein
MSRSNVYVVLASINSINKDQLNVGFFFPEDAINNRYIAPFTNIETRENESSLGQGKWRFITDPEDEWRPFGTFVSLDEEQGVSVVHRASPCSFALAHKGAEKWRKLMSMILPERTDRMSLHR